MSARRLNTAQLSDRIATDSISKLIFDADFKGAPLNSGSGYRQERLEALPLVAGSWGAFGKGWRGCAAEPAHVRGAIRAS